MESIYEEKIDKILSGDDKKFKGKKLTQLLKDSGYDHYVMARVAQFRYENGFQGFMEFFTELQKDDDYFLFSTYYIGAAHARKGRYEEASIELEKILHYDGICAEKARNLYPEVLYCNGEYDSVLDFFDYLKENDLLNDAAYFYVGKIHYFNHDLDQTKIFVDKAIEMNPDEVKYHVFKRALCLDTKDYKGALNEIRTLQSLDINPSLRVKLDLLVPQIYETMGYSGQAFKSIKSNIDKGINNECQEQSYFRLASRFGDFQTVDEISSRLIPRGDFSYKNFTALIFSYQDENLCSKVMKLFKNELKEAKDLDISFAKASTYVQMGKYEEAKNVLRKLMKVKKDPFYYRTYAYCLFLEGDINRAEEKMRMVPPADNRLDVYLRFKLGLLGDYIHMPKYAQLLNDYDFNVVYKDIRNRLSNPDKPSRLNEGINVGRFASEIREIVKSTDPTYKSDKDSYLIDYGEEIATVNGTPTKHFIADAIPGGELLTIKPVIPSNDGISNYQRIR